MTEQLPPDPAAYDSPRAAGARARGLSAPYIPGGRDPDPETGRREESFNGRHHHIVILIQAFGAFVLGIVANLLGFNV